MKTVQDETFVIVIRKDEHRRKKRYPQKLKNFTSSVDYYLSNQIVFLYTTIR